MSNDPFADPPTPSPRTSFSQNNRQSLPANGSHSNFTVSPSNADPTDPHASNASNRNSLAAPPNIHGRTASSDPMGLDTPTSNHNRSSHVHDRTISSDPTAVDPISPGAGSNPNTSGDFTDDAPPKKKGWSLFKSKEEKQLEAVETEHTDGRKPITSEMEKDFKAIKEEYATVKKHFETVAKEYKKLQEKMEADHVKIRDEIKKERKSEILELNVKQVADHKETKKLVKRRAAERKAEEAAGGAKPAEEKKAESTEEKKAESAEEKKESAEEKKADSEDPPKEGEEVEEEKK